MGKRQHGVLGEKIDIREIIIYYYYSEILLSQKRPYLPFDLVNVSQFTVMGFTRAR